MVEKRVMKEQLKSALSKDLDELAERMADAINKAEWGHIIDQSEEPVRDAHADFRRQAYQKALELLANSEKSFSPYKDPTGSKVEKQGQEES
ncbi:MAG: hypothetical protein GY799_16445 [Desulfobulbaceae bacterium]|nr:hypothetical protein [Desulfobulbaceae bacterium]